MSQRGPKPRLIRIAPGVRMRLMELVRASSSEQRLVLRARIILHAARGVRNAEIARRVGCTVRTVRKWRARFAQESTVACLEDRPRSGRPPRIEVEARCELIRLACSRPKDSGVRFRDLWTHSSLSDALQAETGLRISNTEIGRILRNSEIRPHKVRYWLHSPDPSFAEKARAICDLYRKPPNGATVLCIDEKTGMQALDRKWPLQVASPTKVGRFEYEYKRCGTRTLIAAFETQTGQVFGRCGKSRKANDLVDFMERVAERYPGEVYVVWDNLNIHHGERWIHFNKRHQQRFRFVYTPLHASWLNQVEIWFGILQRRVLRYGTFSSVRELSQSVAHFIRHWNRHEAHPFRWTFRGRYRENKRFTA